MARAIALLLGTAFGFVLAWARVTDPTVIRHMLLLREAYVFLLMGSAMVVAALGVRVLRASRARSLVTHEAIGWTLTPPAARHVIGSVVFGAGWSVAATCPGPVAAMIGEGRLGGLFVVAGLVIGIVVQGRLTRRRVAPGDRPDVPATACL